MNDTQITFCGWVGSDVTLAEVAPGLPVATFRVGSTPRRYRGGSWENGPTSWFTVKAWRRLAEHVHRSISSGDPVVVQGRLVADVWKREDGTVSTKYVVVAQSVGHDLNLGTSDFSRSIRREPAGVDESEVQQVIHSYDESGPTLDGDGHVVDQPAASTGEDASPLEPAA
jgi:single-strand DNA-binding protein